MSEKKPVGTGLCSNDRIIGSWGVGNFSSNGSDNVLKATDRSAL